MPSIHSAKSLTVLNVAYPLFPVGPGSGGGAEQILYSIDRGLVSSGHRSIVLAAEKSVVSGRLIPTPAFRGEITEAVRHDAERFHREKLSETIKDYPVDVIHFHGLDFKSYRLASSRVPQLATLHLPLDWYPREIFDSPGLYLNCVSQSQAASNTSALTLDVIPNGIDLTAFRVAERRGEYLLWLGRLCQEKGVAIALRVAHRLGLSLIVAGPVHPFGAHKAYFAEEVMPLLDEKRIYAGPVAGSEKAKLLAEARCVLIPSLVAETSSLVAMEAFASGTPVVGFASGALPEVVERGVTGFIVASEGEMADAVAETRRISPEACRFAACKRFSADRMVADYLDLYRKILASHPVYA